MLDVMLLLGKYAQHRAYIVEPGMLLLPLVRVVLSWLLD